MHKLKQEADKIVIWEQDSHSNIDDYQSLVEW